MVMDEIPVALGAVRPLHALNIFICLQNRNDGAHMFDIINLEIQLEAEKIGVLSVRWMLEMLPPCWLITVASEASEPGSFVSTVLRRPLTRRRDCPFPMTRRARVPARRRTC